MKSKYMFFDSIYFMSMDKIYVARNVPGHWDQITALQNISNWKGPIRITESISLLQVQNQTKQHEIIHSYAKYKTQHLSFLKSVTSYKQPPRNGPWKVPMRGDN